MPIPVPVRVVRWIARVKYKFLELVMFLETLRVTLSLKTDIFISELEAFRLKLKATVATIEESRIRAMVKLLESAVTSGVLKLKIILLEMLPLTELLKLHILFKKLVLLLDTLLIKLLLYEATSILHAIKVKLSTLESMVMSDFLKLKLELKASMSHIEELRSSIIVKKLESLSIGKLLQLKLRARPEAISTSDKLVQSGLQFLKSLTLSDSLYYETYPFEYSLDIISGYPSKTFPSLDITSTEVRTYGEVTIG